MNIRKKLFILTALNLWIFCIEMSYAYGYVGNNQLEKQHLFVSIVQVERDLDGTSFSQISPSSVRRQKFIPVNEHRIPALAGMIDRVDDRGLQLDLAPFDRDLVKPSDQVHVKNLQVSVTTTLCPSTESLTPVSRSLVEQACASLDEWESKLTGEGPSGGELSGSPPIGFEELKKAFDERLKQKLQVKLSSLLKPGETMESIILNLVSNRRDIVAGMLRLQKLNTALSGLNELIDTISSDRAEQYSPQRDRFISLVGKLQQKVDTSFQVYLKLIAKLAEFETSDVREALKLQRTSNSSSCVQAVLIWVERHSRVFRKTHQVEVEAWRIDLEKILRPNICR